MRQVGGHIRTVHNRPLVSSRDHDLESMAIRVRGTADAALSGALLLGVHVPPHDVHEEVAIVPRLLVRDACTAVILDSQPVRSRCLHGVTLPCG